MTAHAPKANPHGHPGNRRNRVEYRPSPIGTPTAASRRQRPIKAMGSRPNSSGKPLPKKARLIVGKVLLRGDYVGPRGIGTVRERDELLVVAPGLRPITLLFGGFGRRGEREAT